MRRITTFLMLSLGIPLCLVSQRLEYAQGEIIVQLVDNISTSAISLPEAKSHARNNKSNWQPIKNAPFNLHVLSIDHTRYNENQYIKELFKDPNVLHAQRNKIVTPRLIPDDTLFVAQWQYINTGASGGLIGADIDADIAWGITTGGVTATGDTIVACIIDDGYDVDHEDMIDNLWVNHDEIPGDGIDNDNNGYIDDINGWNYMNNNNDVSPNGSHGTPVAGIVGAKGNNKVGVAGVNWDVKLMIIKYRNNLTESNVIESYSYAYDKRKRYNETNGTEGAFVVSTNASWGIDAADPAESPIWCAFYDALGEVGILSCGATANDNINVDLDGDLPTGCGSDYLVSVTNLNRQDLKVNRAGFGRITIDLGAHGADAFTVESNNGYGGFGGTSGATPHVTGAIALLYSVPCGELMNIVKKNPALAAITVKEMLLNTVDELDGLNGITTSRGRLNLGNAVKRAEALCSNNGDAYGFSTDRQDVGSFTFNWNENKSNIQTDIRIKNFDATLWVEYLDVEPGFQLDGLDICALYEYQTRAYPAGEPTTYGFSRFVETKGCCYASDIESINVVNGQAQITMSNELIEIENILEYRKFGQSEWDTLIVTSEASIENLEDCELLEYRLSTICNEFSNKSLTSPSDFISTGCGNCTSLDYCKVENFINADEWIDTVEIGNIFNATSKGVTGFNEYTGGFMPKLAVGLTYPFKITPGFSGQEFAEHYKIFIDLDQNGVFDDNEELYKSLMSSSAPVIDQFTIPMDATIGTTRMRIIMAYNSTVEVCNDGSTFGEVEDYCVEVTEVSGTDDGGLNPQAITVSPNITQDQFSVTMTHPSKNGVLGVYDMTGMLIMNQPLNNTQESITLDASGWSRGTYLIVYKSENKLFTKKLVKI